MIESIPMAIVVFGNAVSDIYDSLILYVLQIAGFDRHEDVLDEARERTFRGSIEAIVDDAVTAQTCRGDWRADAVKSMPTSLCGTSTKRRLPGKWPTSTGSGRRTSPASSRRAPRSSRRWSWPGTLTRGSR